MGTLVKRQIFCTSLGVLGILCLLTACGSGGNAPKSLTAAQIYANSQNPASLKDMTFDVSFSLSYTSTLNLTGGGTATRNPNRSDIPLSGSLLGKSFSIETLIDGTDMYTKQTPSDNGNKWTKGASGSGLSFDTSSLINFGNMKNVILLGTETINGYASYHLQGILPGTPSADNTSTSAQEDLWVRTDNFYPVKATGHSINTPTTVPANTESFTTTFKTWNTGITITVPSPSEIATTP